MSKKSLRERCKEWQQLLGLSHWNIEVKFVRKVDIDDDYDFDGYTLLCNLAYIVEEKKAVIRINRDDACLECSGLNKETAIVLELLHLICDYYYDDDDIDNQALDNIARCLVGLKNGGKIINEELSND